MSRLKRVAAKNIDIDIADILESEISVNVDIGKVDIDPALQRATGSRLAS